MLVGAIDAEVDRDRAADRAVLDRVANEIVDDLMQPVMVPRADDRPAVIGEEHGMSGCSRLSRRRNVIAN